MHDKSIISIDLVPSILLLDGVSNTLLHVCFCVIEKKVGHTTFQLLERLCASMTKYVEILH